MKWADEFERLFPGVMDKGTMLGWFANAIETGVMLGEAAAPASSAGLDGLRAALEQIAAKHYRAGDGLCEECNWPFPCDTREMASAALATSTEEPRA
jgi:hypothetical protein